MGAVGRGRTSGVSPPRRVFLTLVVLVAAAAGACGGGDAPVPARSGAPKAPGEAVSFQTPDGVTLRGQLTGTGTTAVVLAHMFPADATSWYPMAEHLASVGYTALAFNFRGYDGSDGTKDVAKADVDLRAAYDFVVAGGAQRVALVGASMGGTASVIVAAATQPVALVAVSAPTMFQGLDALTSAPGVHAPTLLMASREDGSAAASLRALAGKIPGAKESLFPGDAHGTNLLSSRPDATDALVAFLREHAPVGG